MAQTVKNPPANSGDLGSIPGLGRSPGGGHGNTLQRSCLENPVDRGAWRATVHVVAKSLRTKNNTTEMEKGKSVDKEGLLYYSLDVIYVYNIHYVHV